MGKNVKSSPRVKAPAIQSNQTKPKTMLGNCAANIKVVVRVRPPNKRENDENYKNIIRIIDDKMLIFDPKENSQAFFYHNVQQKYRDLLKKPNKNMQFVFDRVFGYESTNDEIFEDTTKNLINSLMDGYNCSVFAYGATGAGKTHTMLGDIDNPGITYLTMTELFKAKQELCDERKFDLYMTYIEVYNETVQDLLNPGQLLQLREDSKYGVTVSGVKTCKIENPTRLFTLLKQGNGNRTQHPTDANAESSRSHAVFQVYIQMEIKTTREVRAAKLSMIDLAGSERGSATGFTGARFTEGANINKSLLALGNCINSLADGHRHIPYRDSKLTRLLKDSLGGNCQTVMIANISPSQATYEDTYNTLKYASRAKKIKSNMKRNIVNVELRAGEYAKIIENLRNELEQVKNELNKKAICVEVDENLVKELMELFNNKKDILEKIFHIECSENMLILRRQFKEEIDLNLQGLCADTPEREDLQRRLTNLVDRFHKREETFAREVEDLRQSSSDIDNQIDEFIKKHPEVETVAKIEAMKLEQAETQYQVELERKKSSLLEDELKHKCNLLEKTWQTLQPCYMKLRGLGYSNDSTVNNYRTLVRSLRRFKNITWDENDLQTKNTENTIIIDNQTNKRKINDENINILDGTYVLESVKSKRLNNDDLEVKVHKSPLPNKPKIVLKRTPTKNLKLMTSPKNRQLLKNTKKIKNCEVVSRPPFR